MVQLKPKHVGKLRAFLSLIGAAHVDSSKLTTFVRGGAQKRVGQQAIYHAGQHYGYPYRCIATHPYSDFVLIEFVVIDSFNRTRTSSDHWRPLSPPQ